MAESTEKWQSGDIGAFEALFHQHQGLVFRTAYLMTGDKNEAEEVLQEVFVAVWKSRRSFDAAKGKLTTWLHQITVNQCISRHRRKRPAPLSLERAREDGVDLLRVRPEQRPEDPEDIAMRRLEYERVLEAMSHLSGKHRQTLVLRYFNDLPYGEIAQVLGIPVGTVKSRINQAINTLREQLKPQQGEHDIDGGVRS